MLRHAAILLGLTAASAFADESAVIARMAACEHVVCLKDAYFTPHAVSRGVRFFYYARLLQMIPRNRATEASLLETLPKTAKEADALLSFMSATIEDDDDRELRDEIAGDVIEIYRHAAGRHPEYGERFAAAEPLLREARARLTQRAGTPGSSRSTPGNPPRQSPAVAATDRARASPRSSAEGPHHRGTEIHRGSQRKAERENRVTSGCFSRCEDSWPRERVPRRHRQHNGEDGDEGPPRLGFSPSLPFSVNLCGSLCLCGRGPSAEPLRRDALALLR
jgi:hypothetical protein